MLYETRWAQLARMGSGPPSTWTEVAVTFNGEDTYPYPGRQQLTQGNAYRTQDLTMVDPTSGRAKDRGSLYEQPKYAAPTAKNIDGNYPII